MSVPRAASPVPLAALFAATAALFLPTLLSYHSVWLQQPYTHGYLVLAATLWLIWRERRVFRGAGTPWAPALTWAAGLSLIWWVAQVTNVRVIAQGALPLLLLLWAGGALGTRVAMRLAPVTAVFLLAVPFWEVLTPALQAVTVLVTGLVIRALGVPATIEGNVVHVPSGSFLIEDGCAGLNYLLSGLVIGALYAQSFVRRWPTRAAVVGLAAGIAILGNWLRVGALIVIGHVTGMRSGLMEGHLTFGWVIFFVGLFVFFPLARVIEKRDERLRPREGVTPVSPPVAAQRSDDRAGPSLRPALLASLAVALGPLLYYGIGALPAREVPLAPVGGRGDGWALSATEPVRPYGWRPAFPTADDETVAAWTNGPERVVVDRLAYRAQSSGVELVGFGSRIAPDSLLVMERLFGQVGPERRLVNEAIVRDGNGYVLVWYWYRVGGVETQSPARAKLLEMWAFVRRATRSELIAISAPCAPDDCAAASQVLASFLGSA